MQCSFPDFFHAIHQRRRKVRSNYSETRMTSGIPYTYYACPCVDTSAPSTFEHKVWAPSSNPDDDEQNESSLDPNNPHANHVLYPLENLLFCNECHELRCQKCYYEEVLYYYCPSCLMETASTSVRTETNR